MSTTAPADLEAIRQALRSIPTDLNRIEISCYGDTVGIYQPMGPDEEDLELASIDVPDAALIAVLEREWACVGAIENPADGTTCLTYVRLDI